MSSIRVYASKINNTNIMVFKDDIVTIDVVGNQTWNDFWIECDANGWNNSIYQFRFIELLKNIPKENFMKLCAKIGSEFIPIGQETTFVANEDGIISLFANDINFLRWNNSGFIDVNIIILKTKKIYYI